MSSGPKDKEPRDDNTGQAFERAVDELFHGRRGDDEDDDADDEEDE